MNTNDREKSIQWAKNILDNDNWCIIDTETTGMGKYSQIVDIGIITSSMLNGWHSLVKPTITISEEATKIHGITNDAVKEASYFEHVFIDLWMLTDGRDVIFYNADFDIKLIRQSLKARDIQIVFPTSDRRGCRIFTNGGSIHCAMQQHAQYVGEWNEQYGNYKYQSLPESKHSVLEDCRATLQVIKKMADTDNQEVVVNEPNSTEESNDDEDNIPF